MAISKKNLNVSNGAAIQGNRNQCSRCGLINDKTEFRRVERYWQNHQRLRFRTKSRFPGRRVKYFRDRQSDEMSRVPLINGNVEMTGSNPRNLVILEVGPPGDTWRYSIEREQLAEKSEWFRAMLLGDLAPPPSDPPPTLPLQHVDKRAFDHLLTYLRGEPLNFYSVSTARSTLDVAHQLLCPQLAQLAIDYITANLSTSNILAVYHGLHLYLPDDVSTPDGRDPKTPSAPPHPSDDIGQIAVSCSKLLSKCHKIVDVTPDEVLQQENFEELSSYEVAELASRDELRLVDEGVLFRALEKWAASECRRQGFEPTAFNKRNVLDDEVWFSVRYLQMRSNQFIDGPMRSGILTPEESSYIVARILRHDVSQANLPNSLVATRLTTTPRNPMKNGSSKNSCIKLGKKEREDNKRNRRKECANQGHKACARIGDYIIRILACVFD